MRKLCVVIIIVVLLTPTMGVRGQTLPWIEEFTMKNYATNQMVLAWQSDTGQLLQNAPVLAGDEYILTFTLNVRQTVDNAVLELILSNSIEKQSEEVFWEIETIDLPLTDDFNPSERRIMFNHTMGVYEISIIGKIDKDLTTSAGTTVALHRPVDLTILMLIGPADSIYDEIEIHVIDSKIDDYQFILSQKEVELQDYIESDVDPAYIQLYENFVALAKDEAEFGLVDSAMDLLNTLEVEAPPIQTGPSFQEKYFIPAVGGLLVLFILSLVLFMRTRTRAGFITMIMEDQIRELEALQSRASRIDRNLALRLQEINDRLKEAERS
ncbi:MAG: hypothetical protein NWE89_08890 [Candidatus Bathyarchaeota archaeon]|nr:hypothetical protein [Candidatus Bathyarchaeota archaeon]